MPQRKYVDASLAAAVPHTDANNFIYYVDASRNYDPSAHLDRITVPVMFINSADDFINPPELGIAEKLTKAFSPERLAVVDESSRHEGHAGWREGGETHFRVSIVAAAFAGKSRLERHRLINQALSAELAGGVHALAIEAAAPGEAS